MRRRHGRGGWAWGRTVHTDHQRAGADDVVNGRPANSLQSARLIVMLDVEVREGQSDPEWDNWVAAAPGGHHLQTSGWGYVKAGAGWHARRILRNNPLSRRHRIRLRKLR